MNIRLRVFELRAEGAGFLQRRGFRLRGGGAQLHAAVVRAAQAGDAAAENLAKMHVALRTAFFAVECAKCCKCFAFLSNLGGFVRSCRCLKVIFQALQNLRTSAICSTFCTAPNAKKLVEKEASTRLKKQRW